MNAQEAREAIQALYDGDREVRFETGHQNDDGSWTVTFEVGRMVTESFIEADFHDERFEPQSAYEVTIDGDGKITQEFRSEIS